MSSEGSDSRKVDAAVARVYNLLMRLWFLIREADINDTAVGPARFKATPSAFLSGDAEEGVDSFIFTLDMLDRDCPFEPMRPHHLVRYASPNKLNSIDIA